jgi:hypothetical protein
MTTILVSRAKLTMARIVAALSASVVERLMNDWQSSDDLHDLTARSVRNAL